MRSSLLIIAAIIIVSSSIKAQWVEMDNPGQGVILSLCNEGDTIYAGTTYHLVRSTDNGETWEKKQNGIPSTHSFNSMAVGGGYIFVTQEGYGIYRSSDHGDNWTSIFSNLPQFAKSFRKVYYKDGYLYLGVTGFESQGFYYSTDFGSSWNTYSNGPDTTVTAIAKYEDMLLAGTVTNKVYKTTDNGLSWASGVITTSSTDIRDFARQDTNIYLTTGGDGVYRSKDGINWESKSSGLPQPISWTRSITAVDSTVFTGIDNFGNGGIWKSTDLGESWNNISGTRLTFTTSPPFNNVDVFYKINSMLLKDSLIFLGTSYHGLLKSTDLGSTWKNVITPLQFAYFKTIGTWGDTVAAGSGDSEGLYLSTDKGDTWNFYNTNLIGYVKTIVKKDSIFFVGVGTVGGFAIGAYKSTDGGISWDIINNGLPHVNNNSMILKDDKLYSGTDQGLFVSTDDGNQWNPTGWTQPVLNVFSFDNTMFLSRITPALTFRSTDNGATWDTLKNGIPPNFAAYAIVKLNSTLFACGTGNSKLLKSTDDGINWTQINSSFTSINDLDVNGIVLYINHTTPYFSTDLGETWTQINLAGGPNSFQKIKVANGYFYGAGGGSVGKSIYRKNLSSIVNIEVQEYLLPVAYDLLQNYPNPFNPSTKISWQSPVGSHQTLKIYDVLGNEVATLLDEYTEAGRYEITFDASRLASGIYFYRLQAGQFIETRKMILLK